MWTLRKGDTSEFIYKTRVMGVESKHGYQRVRGGKREIVRLGLTYICYYI